MITKISGFNFKGKTFNQSVGQKVIFCGERGAGKTSLFQAVTLSMLGHVPHGDKPMKRPIDSMRFASGGFMNVGLEFDSGFSIGRQYKFKGKNATVETTCLPLGGEQDPETRIAKEVGSFPLMFNAGEFLSLSSNQQKKFIFGLCEVNPKWKREDILSGVEEDISSSWKDDMGIQEGLDAVIARIRSEISFSEKRKRSLIATCQRLAESRMNCDRTGNMSIAELKSERESLGKELIDIEVQLARDEERIRAYEKREQEESFLLKSIETAEKNVKNLNAELKSLMIEKEAIEALAKAADHGVNHPKEDIDGIKSRIRELEALIRVDEKRLDELETIKGGHCPFNEEVVCQVDHTVAKENLIDNIGRQHVELKELNQDLRTMTTESDKYKSHQADLIAISRIAGMIGEKEKAIETAESSIADTKEKLAALKKEAEEDMEKHGGIVTSEDLVSQKDGVKMRIQSIDSEIEKAEQQKSLEMEYQNAQTEKLKLEDHLLQLRATETRIGPKGVLGEIIKESLDPLYDTANELLQQIRQDYKFAILTSDHKGNETFDLGWQWPDGSFVPFESLSGGETAIFTAALMAALIKLRNPKTKILMVDEAQNIGSDSDTNVFLRGIGMFDSFLDNILVATNRDIDEEDLPDGWSKVKITRAS